MPERRRPVGRGVRPAAHLVLALVATLVASTSVARGQEYGRWSWTAAVSAGQRGQSNQVGATESSVKTGYLRLDTNFHGFLGHPALGSFDFGLGFDLTQADQGRSGSRRDVQQLSYAVNFSILPQAKVATRLYAARRDYQQGGPGLEGIAETVRLPDATDSWGARAHVRRGALTGLLVGVDQDSLRYRNATGVSSDARDNEFVTFARSGRTSHFVRVDRHRRDLAYSDFASENLLLRLHESGPLAGRWRWSLSGTGFRYDLESDAGALRRTEQYGLSNDYSMDRSNGDGVTLQWDAGTTRWDAGDGLDRAGAYVGYRFRRHRHWSFSPFASYDAQRSDMRDIDLPQAGLTVSWRRPFGRWDFGVTGTGAAGQVTTDANGMTFTDRSQRWALAASATHGDAAGLRKEIEVEWTRNDFDNEPQTIEVLSGIIAPFAVGLVQSSVRGRAELSHAWDSRSLSGWGEYRRFEHDADVLGTDATTETLAGSVRFQAHRYGLTATTTSGRVLGPQGERSSLSSSASAYWKPRRWLRAFGRYRVDDRELGIVPGLSGNRFDVGVDVDVALLTVEAWVYEATEGIDGLPERTWRGFQWGIRRRFGGLLPVVTGTQRNGVIR